MYVYSGKRLYDVYTCINFNIEDVKELFPFARYIHCYSRGNPISFVNIAIL